MPTGAKRSERGNRRLTAGEAEAAPGKEAEQMKGKLADFFIEWTNGKQLFGAVQGRD
jgi:hypothetical protein